MCIYIYVYVCVSGAPIQFFLGQCRPPSLTSARFCFSRTAQIVDVSVHAVASSYDPHRVQELYKAFLKDSDFVEKRFQKICKQQGVGPQKLARYRARGKVNDLNERLYIYICMERCAFKVPVVFSLVDVQGRSVTEAEAGLHRWASVGWYIHRARWKMKTTTSSCSST